MTGTRFYTVEFTLFEDGQYLTERDTYEATSEAEALQFAREDYGGCDSYTVVGSSDTADFSNEYVTRG